MIAQLSFSDVLESVEALPDDEREMLVDIVRKRMSEKRREEIIRSVREADAEFAAGKCKPATVDEIMHEILS